MAMIIENWIWCFYFAYLAVGPRAAGREVKISSPFLKYRLSTNATKMLWESQQIWASHLISRTATRPLPAPSRAATLYGAQPSLFYKKPDHFEFHCTKQWMHAGIEEKHLLERRIQPDGTRCEEGRRRQLHKPCKGRHRELHRESTLPSPARHQTLSSGWNLHSRWSFLWCSQALLVAFVASRCLPSLKYGWWLYRHLRF